MNIPQNLLRDRRNVCTEETNISDQSAVQQRGRKRNILSWTPRVSKMGSIAANRQSFKTDLGGVKVISKGQWTHNHTHNSAEEVLISPCRLTSSSSNMLHITFLHTAIPHSACQVYVCYCIFQHKKIPTQYLYPRSILYPGLLSIHHIIMLHLF